MTMSPSSPTTFWYTESWYTTFLIEMSDIMIPPKVVSFSYISSEHSDFLSIYKTFDVIAIKLSIMGTTLVAASGDQGVHSGSQCGYAPGFPAASQYVLSVGGTTVSEISY